jgi:hypothetical protein
MDYKAVWDGLVFIPLVTLLGCGGGDNGDDAGGYKLIWETNFLLPDGYQPLRTDSNDHHFRIDMHGNAYLSFAQAENVEPPYQGLEAISIWQFDGSDWDELPALPQVLEVQDQGYYLPPFSNDYLTLIYFRAVNVGAPWRASQTDALFSTNRYDPDTDAWREITLLDEAYLDPSITHKLSEGESLYVELKRYVQLEPTPCDPDWIEGCYTWDEESLFFTLGDDGWSEIDPAAYAQVVTDTFRVTYDGFETQLETRVNANWQAYGEAVSGEYSLYVDMLKGAPYLYAESKILQMCEQAWCNLLEGYDLGQRPIDGIYFDLNDNLYIYQALGNTYSLYKFSEMAQ